ncbi:MAG: hypothetical protein AAFQ67_04820, partial [Pseudomonadota bacterium]
ATVKKPGPSAGAGGLWRAMKSAAGRGGDDAEQATTPIEAFDAAFDQLGAHVVVTTTTSAERLTENLTACAHRRI